MAEERVILWRCAWIVGSTSDSRDFDTKDQAERRVRWEQRNNAQLKYPVLAYCYPVTVYVEVEESA